MPPRLACCPAHWHMRVCHCTAPPPSAWLGWRGRVLHPLMPRAPRHSTFLQSCLTGCVPCHATTSCPSWPTCTPTPPSSARCGVGQHSEHAGMAHDTCTLAAHGRRPMTQPAPDTCAAATAEPMLRRSLPRCAVRQPPAAAARAGAHWRDAQVGAAGQPCHGHKQPCHECTQHAMGTRSRLMGASSHAGNGWPCHAAAAIATSWLQPLPRAPPAMP